MLYKLDLKNVFHFSLTFIQQLTLQEDIFQTFSKRFPNIFYFSHDLKLSSTLQQLLFHQTYSLFSGWLLIAQMEYQNRDKGCEEIPRQFLRNSQ